MKKLLFLAMISAISALHAQKVIRDEHAQTRSAHGFHGIDVAGGIDLYLSQGTEESVAVSAASPEDRDRIRTEVVNGILKIYFDRGIKWLSGWGDRKLKAYVSVKAIDKLSASGGSDVLVDRELTVSGLVMAFSGGADFKGRVNAKDLSISASGGSDVYISGRAERLNLEAHGGSDVHGFEMTSADCNVQANGGSDIKITATRSISGSANGGSDVYYHGNAVSTVTKSGGSGVKKGG
jgi:hypothetical protein